MGHPTIYPTGVTVYNPDKCWNGFTIFQAHEVGAVLMDMNGREVKVWQGVNGMPNKLLPGGQILTTRGLRNGKYGVQDIWIWCRWTGTAISSGNSTAMNLSKTPALRAAGWPATTMTTSARAIPWAITRRAWNPRQIRATP